ncbi:hypothetical protein IWQ60_003288 [Tieghemiomyces parasiticus]|uniref:Uncharacterized protein n=1 Tax=Tieghemiomyces parasiticus TaxID=78921 RepID=A0A9W8DWL3_9FUNG|nr:hypothetical protein IWQ60_003288 [Tieghemiomyces parasiticus]
MSSNDSKQFKTQVEPQQGHIPNHPPTEQLKEDALLQSLGQKVTFDQERTRATLDMVKDVPLESEKRQAEANAPKQDD